MMMMMMKYKARESIDINTESGTRLQFERCFVTIALNFGNHCTMVSTEIYCFLFFFINVNFGQIEI